jgi:hypothetical protein
MKARARLDPHRVSQGDLLVVVIRAAPTGGSSDEESGEGAIEPDGSFIATFESRKLLTGSGRSEIIQWSEGFVFFPDVPASAVDAG